MSLTTSQRLNRQSFTHLLLPQDVINAVHCRACHNPRGFDIRDRDWRPFLEPEDGANDDDDNSTYVPSDDNDSDTPGDDANADEDGWWHDAKPSEPAEELWPSCWEDGDGSWQDEDGWWQSKEQA